MLLPPHSHLTKNGSHYRLTPLSVAHFSARLRVPIGCVPLSVEGVGNPLLSRRQPLCHTGFGTGIEEVDDPPLSLGRRVHSFGCCTLVLEGVGNPLGFRDRTSEMGEADVI